MKKKQKSIESKQNTVDLMTHLLKKQVHEALDVINPMLSFQPRVALMLGSGLGYIADKLENATAIDVSDIPHYPRSTVPGHRGQWVFGTMHSVPVLAIQGRVHYYEGYSLQQVTFPVHLIAGLKIPGFIVTTSSGGINPSFRAGDIMIIRDHVNLGFHNPLIGPVNQLLGPRFPDMSQPYDSDYIRLALQVGKEKEMKLKSGVFCWMTGPSYETAAEVRLLQKIGVDSVSMSTVPEVIVARQRSLRVLGISLITNQATGIQDKPLSHDEVTETALHSAQRMEALIRGVVHKIGS
jgi:purine-nucleoside phosphorylase